MPWYHSIRDATCIVEDLISFGYCHVFDDFPEGNDSLEDDEFWCSGQSL